MDVKKLLMNASKPFITPITRIILKHHYKSSNKLSDLGSFKRILILAPHADDETIGAGATLRLHADEGAEVYCALVTDGSNSVSGMEKKELTKIRRHEMNQVKDILGFRNIYELNLPDGKVNANTESVQKLTQLIADVQPDLIYCTPFVDAHHDHIHTTKLLADTLRNMDYACTVRLYEINCPIPPGEINCVIDTSGTMKFKEEAINVFSSQAIAFDGFLELNRIKSKLVNKQPPSAVETFIELHSTLFVAQFNRINITEYNYEKLFKQVNRTITLLWAVFKNYNVKKELYKKR